MMQFTVKEQENIWGMQSGHFILRSIVNRLWFSRPVSLSGNPDGCFTCLPLCAAEIIISSELHEFFPVFRRGHPHVPGKQLGEIRGMLKPHCIPDICNA